MKHHKILSALLAASMLGSSATVTVSALSPHGTGVSIRDGWLTNDPSYSFSEAYRASVWYENFTSLELTGNTRNDILAIALSQLGYHGGPVGDYSGTYNGPGTSDAYKCTEYGRLLVNQYGSNYNENAFDWCACFVNWCLNQAHVDYASGELGCWRWVQELKTAGQFQNSTAYHGTYTPKPADMIFFNWEGNNTYSSHVGLVLYVASDRIYTVEGNSGNQVKVRSYALSNPAIIGYGTPPYEEGDVPTVDHSYKGGMPVGTYVMSVAGQSLKTSPGGSTAVSGGGVVPLGGLVELLTVSGNYALVRYGDKRGYVPCDVLYLLYAVREEIVLPLEPPSDEESISLPKDDTESDIEYDTESDIESDIECDTESDTESDIECDTESDIESDIESESESESEIENASQEEITNQESLREDTENGGQESEATTHGAEESDSPPSPIETGCAATTSLASLSFLIAGGAVLLRRRRED